VVHFSSEQQARHVREAIAGRLAQLGLELHPDKTRIVYCKDDDRRGDHEVTSFVFLGYEFRPRLARNRYGKHFVSFLPAVSPQAMKAMGKQIRSWHMTKRSDKSLGDLALMFNSTVQGWINYYGRFYRSRLLYFLRRLNDHLVRWACRKYDKRLVAAAHNLHFGLAVGEPGLDPGHRPAASTLSSSKPPLQHRRSKHGARGTPGHPARQPGHRHTGHTQTLKSRTAQQLSRRPGPAIRPHESSGLVLQPRPALDASLTCGYMDRLIGHAVSGNSMTSTFPSGHPKTLL
jgi:Group II intron, maturase-specific domain